MNECMPNPITRSMGPKSPSHISFFLIMLIDLVLSDSLISVGLSIFLDPSYCSMSPKSSNLYFPKTTRSMKRIKK